MQAYNEAQLLRQLADGEEQALKEIMLRYGDKVFQVARRFVRSGDTAAEITQEVFITIWLRRKQLSHITNIGAYIRCIAKNATIAYFRKLEREASIQYQFLLSHVDEPADADSLLDEPEKDYESLLETCIEKLSPQQKVVLKLKHAGASYHEIATQLKISDNTVKYHLQEARASMRSLLKHHLPICIFTFTELLSEFYQL
jgi:RNA polymerase sigma factor (sigma-70 family)